MTEARVTQGSKNAISVHLFLVQKKPFYNLKTIWIELKKERKKIKLMIICTVLN